MSSFFAELQRRHVYKVGAMYCVSGWLLVQVATQVLPIFDVSALGQRMIVIFIILGFPVAIFLAWTFDLTPRGIERTRDAAGVEAPPPRPSIAVAPAAPQSAATIGPPRAVIAEDETLLRGELRELLGALWPELEICAEATNGFEALRALERFAPNLLFLDIRMPGLTGLEVAARASGRAHVIFLTAYDEYALAAFEQGAVDYVLKPVTAARLAQALARVRERLGSTPADLGALMTKLEDRPVEKGHYLQWISVHEGDDLRLVTVDEISYLRSEGARTIVLTADAEHRVDKPLEPLYSQLDAATFWKTDGDHVVNINAIRSVQRDIAGRLKLSLRQRPETLHVAAAYASHFKNL